MLTSIICRFVTTPKRRQIAQVSCIENLEHRVVLTAGVAGALDFSSITIGDAAHATDTVTGNIIFDGAVGSGALSVIGNAVFDAAVGGTNSLGTATNDVPIENVQTRQDDDAVILGFTKELDKLMSNRISMNDVLISS